MLDTNIIIDHLRLQELNANSVLMNLVQLNPKEALAISILSVQELYEGKSTKNSNKELYLLSTITPLKILPYTYEIAQLGGEIARDINRSIEFVDSALAATAIINQCHFATLNKKDFLGINNLSFII